MARWSNVSGNLMNDGSELKLMEYVGAFCPKTLKEPAPIIKEGTPFYYLTHSTNEHVYKKLDMPDEIVGGNRRKERENETVLKSHGRYRIAYLQGGLKLYTCSSPCASEFFTSVNGGDHFRYTYNNPNHVYHPSLEQNTDYGIDQLYWDDENQLLYYHMCDILPMY